MSVKTLRMYDVGENILTKTPKRVEVESASWSEVS